MGLARSKILLSGPGPALLMGRGQLLPRRYTEPVQNNIFVFFYLVGYAIKAGRFYEFLQKKVEYLVRCCG